MNACVDVYYYDNHAVAAGILFTNWTDSIPTAQYSAVIPEKEPYIPGQFYRRELPCILKVLERVSESVEVILIDGYVWLDNFKSPGLGWYLYDRLNRKIPVIGIAKSRYKRSNVANEVIRGNSRKPLYVTAVGIDQRLAAANIAQMHGKFRIPTLLKKVDQASKDIRPPIFRRKI